MKLIFLIYFSIISLCFGKTYTLPEQSASYTVTINASIEDVWKYNSDDYHAKQWSIYFKEIIPCPIAECHWNKELEPSDLGYTRRPIRYTSEEKIWWDETTILIQKTPQKYYKQILSYNFHTPFSVLNFNEKAEYLVEQIYEKVSTSQTRLTFKAGFIKKNELKQSTAFYEYFVWELIFKWISKDIIEMTFEKNLINIKSGIL